MTTKMHSDKTFIWFFIEYVYYKQQPFHEIVFLLEFNRLLNSLCMIVMENEIIDNLSKQGL